MEKIESNPDVTFNMVLTDICSKSKEKIKYIKRGSVLEIEANNSNSWNFMYQFNSLIKDMFLPKGYPGSVSSDYLEYQIWDTCQAFCSSISGTFAMRAVLQGIGVGSDTATPMSAAITWLMKDGTGMVGSILFAWLKGSKLDSDCKKWRLFADILNDIALFLELYTPYVLEYSMYMLCTATVFKALVGTAGSSTRAALITHQAIKGNIADVSAKDGSQEIFTNLCAFVFGIFLLKNVTETQQVWSVMCTATLFHLVFNYKAVRCLKIDVFNSERFCLCLRTYLPTSIVPTVDQINRRESVFLMRGMSDHQVCGFSIVFGISLKNAIKSPQVTASLFADIMTLFRNKKYIIMPAIKRKKLYVAFQQKITETEVLKAYFHAILLGISLNYLQKRKNLHVLSRCRKNSPVYRLKNILTELSKAETENENKRSTNIAQAYTVCEDLIEKEFFAFRFTCEEEDWNTQRHLINIGDWRAEWKAFGKREKSISNERNVTFKIKVPKERPVQVQQQQMPQRNMQALVIS